MIGTGVNVEQVQGLCLEPVLQTISDFLDDQKDMIEQVRRDLTRGLKKAETGRNGLTPQQLFTWLRQARRRTEAAGTERQAFVPAVVESAVPVKPVRRARKLSRSPGGEVSVNWRARTVERPGVSRPMVSGGKKMERHREAHASRSPSGKRTAATSSREVSSRCSPWAAR